MTGPGRPAKPAAVHKRNGNPGKRKIKEGLPVKAGTPLCPDWLGESGREKWGDLVGLLLQTDGLLTELDGGFLALFCEAHEEFLDARSEIKREGATCTGEKGGAYQHPAVGRKNQAIARMRLLGGLFGMSPSDRAGLNITGAGGGDLDPLTELLKKRGSSN